MHRLVATRRISLLLWCAVALFQPMEGAAQSAPLKGVVWQIPEDVGQAERDLLEMRRMGIEAVRTGLIRRERLLTLADSLGLRLFQELPVEYASASALRDTLAYATRLLETAIARAYGHPSARHFGLARRSDTSDPRACVYFRRLAAHVRQRGPVGSQVYYLTGFIEHDRCAEAVDAVLLDVLDEAAPAGQLQRWRAAQAHERVGVGNLGWWVTTETTHGLRHPRSPASQARYLETHLRTLLADTTETPWAVFVHRWRDVRRRSPSPGYDLSHPYQDRHGLYEAMGPPRLARDVVAGFFTGRQTVFAFQTGSAPPTPVPWILLVGWSVWGLIGLCYARTPTFRLLIRRYFRAHGFYLEFVREGRETMLGVSVLLLVAFSVSIGVLGYAILDVVRQHEAFAVALRQMPILLQDASVTALAQPVLLMLLLSSVYALGVALWTAALSFASRHHHELLPGQALLLVLWPRWTLLALLAGTMFVPTLSAADQLPLVMLLALAWGGATSWAIGRTLFDYAAVTSIPPLRVVLVGLTNPLIIVLVGGAAVTFAFIEGIDFLWHLITRG